VTAGINANQYHHQTTQAEALGAVAGGIQYASEMAGVQGFLGQAGPVYLSGGGIPGSNGSAQGGDRGTDLNAGVEFRIMRQLNLWFQMNNIFNDKYQRWNQYQVYGFNVLGGIVFSLLGGGSGRGNE
jgi:hypothetical protein